MEHVRSELAGPQPRQPQPIERDWHVWITTLFPEYVSSFAPFHEEMWSWLWDIQPDQKPPPFVGIWPRETGKSTNAEIGCVAVAARQARSYGLYVSATQNQADDHVQNVASLLESDKVEAYYPDLASRRVGKYGSSKGWRRNRLRTASGFTVDAIGLDTAARGMKLESARPDFIVIDDIDEESDSPDTTRKKIRRLTQAILPAGSYDVAILAVQNLVIPDGVFSRLAGLAEVKADFLADRIVSGPHPAIRDLEYGQDEEGRIRLLAGEPTWPEMDLVRYQQVVSSIGITAFLIEYQHQVRERGSEIYRRSWWDNRNRYEYHDRVIYSTKTAIRWISWDTALSDDGEAAYSAAVVGEMGADRVLRVREVFRAHLNFPDLIDAIQSLAEKYNVDGKLAEVIIENKVSGISAIQTIRSRSPRWLRSKIIAWNPRGDKEQRAAQAAVWCRSDMVQLPLPEDDPDLAWLLEFEQELYRFPRSINSDQVDAFSQQVIYVEKWIEQGWRARQARAA